jgi:hypothetical protein
LNGRSLAGVNFFQRSVFGLAERSFAHL